MIADRFMLQHSTRSKAAVAAFETATFALAAHRPETAQAITSALHADERLVAAHALLGFGQVLLARSDTMDTAREAFLSARTALAVKGGTLDEHVLVDALRLAVRGRCLAAADRIDDHLAGTAPRLLLFKLAQALRFMGGDGRGMLVASHAALGRWPAELPGFGLALGCHAFNLEEAGEYALAEESGREALEIEPQDAWGLHAVSHVYEMTGRSADGIAWLEGKQPVWSGCNNFGLHVAWHLALFHLERGDAGRALELYDGIVQSGQPEDFRNLANSVSLLWRMRQAGLDVGDRWRDVSAMARRRRQDTTLVFAALHHMLALLASGRTSDAAQVAATLDRLARAGDGTDQSRVAASVGAELARVLAGMVCLSRPALERLVRLLPKVGGSNAQRDVFVRTLALAAVDAGDAAAAAAVMDARRRLRRDDRFARLVSARLEACGTIGRRVA